MKGILGRKLGMTEVFGVSGKLIPVTVIEVEPNVITQIKTTDKDGYNAIQIAFDTVREKISNKAQMGITKNANTTPKRFLREIRNVNVEDYKVGDELKADIFTVGEMVDVTGTSKGKGFQGVIKRHNQSRGPMGHGSHYHRLPGSMGTMRPMRVIPGKKLPGQMGAVQVTIQNLEIVSIDLENNIILVKGNVPGAKKSMVMIRSAIKNQDVINEREDLVSYIEIEDVPVVEEVIEESIQEEMTEEPIQEEVVEESSQEEVVEESSQEEAVEEIVEETIETPAEIMEESAEEVKEAE